MKCKAVALLKIQMKKGDISPARGGMSPFWTSEEIRCMNSFGSFGIVLVL